MGSAYDLHQVANMLDRLPFLGRAATTVRAAARELEVWRSAKVLGLIRTHHGKEHGGRYAEAWVIHSIESLDDTFAIQRARGDLLDKVKTMESELRCPEPRVVAMEPARVYTPAMSPSPRSEASDDNR